MNEQQLLKRCGCNHISWSLGKQGERELTDDFSKKIDTIN